MSEHHAANELPQRGTIVKSARVIALLSAAGVLLAGCSADQRVTSLEVGDCFDDSAEILAGEDVSRVPSVPCTEPHDNEVFHVSDYSGSTYSFEGIADFADIVCYSAFEPYVGRSYETSAIDFTWLIPTEESWTLGDREVVCIAFHMNYEKLQRSVRGSGL